jgi:hypothetical protein
MSPEVPQNGSTGSTRRTNPGLHGPRDGWLGRALLVALFAVAFGYVESAVVVYLRVIYDPVRASLYPQKPPQSLLPLMTVEQLRAVDPLHVRRLVIELGRELATMVLLVTVACLAARRRGERAAMFMIAFGMWDITYYVGLKAMIGFPGSLLTWDILFLIPVPWLGPVLAPVIVSLSMIAAGLVILAETGRGRAFRPAWFHRAGVVLGGLIIIASFCKDYARTMVGEMPGPFNWFIFAAGEAVGLLAFGHAAAQARRSLHA